MNIKIPSTELNRMMKTVAQCIDERNQKFGNIEISCGNNLLMIRGTDGQFSAVTVTPFMGCDGEKFCVDGTTFAKVCSMCNGDVSIETDGKFCTIKGAGRTRIPIVKADVPNYPTTSPDTNPVVSVKAEDFAAAFSSVSHAISIDQSRLCLTGVLTEVDETGLRMTTLDGFRLAIETIDCDGDPMKMIVPGAFMKLIQSSTSAGETITIVNAGNRIEASTESMKITCGLLTGDFPDVQRIIPKDFKTECIVNVEQIRNALRNSNVLNSKNNLVKFSIEENTLKVMSNSDQADYEAQIDCDTHGDGLQIAFNQKYVIDTFASVTDDNAIVKCNSPISPCVIHGKTDKGLRLVLPVRVAG